MPLNFALLSVGDREALVRVAIRAESRDAAEDGGTVDVGG